MKFIDKFFIVALILIGCATAPVAYTGPDHDTEISLIYPKVNKIIAEASPTIILRRYIISGTSDNEIGVYKIEVGDQDRIRQALTKISIMGFNGEIFIRDDIQPWNWQAIKITVDYKEGLLTRLQKLIVSKEIIGQRALPRNMGHLSPEYLHLAEHFSVYRDYPESLSVFVKSGTTIPEAYKLMYKIKEILNDNAK